MSTANLKRCKTISNMRKNRTLKNKYKDVKTKVNWEMKP